MHLANHLIIINVLTIHETIPRTTPARGAIAPISFFPLIYWSRRSRSRRTPALFFLFLFLFIRAVALPMRLPDVDVGAALEVHGSDEDAVEDKDERGEGHGRDYLGPHSYAMVFF